MKKGALFLICIVFAIGVGFWIQKAYQPQRESIPDPLIVGTSADYKPLAFRDENNDIQGFDIDLTAEIARRLGVTYRIKDLAFEFLLYELQNTSIHVVAAGLSYTEKRAEQVTFTQPYMVEDPLVVVTTADKQEEIQDVSDLYHKTVAVNQGYTAETYITSFDTITPLRLPSVSEAILALKAGKADAFVTASHSMKPVLQEYGGDDFAVFSVHNATETISLAVSQAYPKLHTEINRIVTQLQNEGILEHLKDKWQIS